MCIEDRIVGNIELETKEREGEIVGNSERVWTERIEEKIGEIIGNRTILGENEAIEIEDRIVEWINRRNGLIDQWIIEIIGLIIEREWWIELVVWECQGRDWMFKEWIR